MPENEVRSATPPPHPARGRTRGRCRVRAEGWLAFSALVLLGAATASAERVVQVRVGEHDEFTRVVIELDGQAAHRLVRSLRTDAHPELMLRIDATAEPREVRSKSPLVGAVTLSPDGAGTIARIALRADDVRVDEKRFTNPERIVLDLHRAPASTPPRGDARAGGTTARTETSGASPPVAPPAAEPESAGGEVDALAVASEGATEPAPIEPLAVENPSAPAQAADTAPPTTAPTADAPSTAEAPPEPPADAPPLDAALASRGVEAPSAGSSTQPASPPSSAGEVTAPSSRLDSASADHPDVAGPSTTLLPGGIDPRVLVGGAVVLLSVILLWGVLGRRDRTAVEAVEAIGADASAFADRAVGSPWEADRPAKAEFVADAVSVPEDDTPAVHGAPESEAASATEPRIVIGGDALPVEEEPDDHPVPRLTLVPSPVDAAAPSVVDPGAVALSTPSAGRDAVADSPEAAVERVHTLEQRIAVLERRLEDAAESRERIERQLVAQTEELRVQRAAIARTQRVLRSIAKPEELAMEPVPPRGPSGAMS